MLNVTNDMITTIAELIFIPSYFIQSVIRIWQKQITRFKKDGKEPSYFRTMLSYSLPRLVPTGILLFIMVL